MKKLLLILTLLNPNYSYADSACDQLFDDYVQLSKKYDALEQQQKKEWYENPLVIGLTGMVIGIVISKENK